MRIFLMLLVLGISASSHALTVSIKSADEKFKLETEKVAFIIGSIDSNSSMFFQGQVLSTIGLPGDRLIIIDSPGGNVGDGNEIINTIKTEQFLQTKVHCLVIGRAYSMAFNLLSYCDVRLATPKAEFLFHSIYARGLESSEGRSLNPINLRKIADEMEKDNDVYAEANRKQLNMSRKDYDLFSDEEHMFKAKDMKDKGFVNFIIIPPTNY